MLILKEELALSLKALKHVDIAGSGCSVYAVLIFVQWLFPKMTWINVEGIQISESHDSVFPSTLQPSGTGSLLHATFTSLFVETLMQTPPCLTKTTQPS